MKNSNNKLSESKQKIEAFFDAAAGHRNAWIKKNEIYYKDLIKFYKHTIPEKSSILEIGSGSGYLLNQLNPKRGTGIDISQKMVDTASKYFRNILFQKMDAENLKLFEKFNYIIISDTLGYFADVQKAFHKLRQISTPKSRIVINYHNYLWMPILSLAEIFRFKMHAHRLNWLNHGDISGLLSLEGFEVIKKGQRFIFPKYIPLVSHIFNEYLAFLPLLNKLCITNFVIAKQIINYPPNNKLYSVSIIIPARNEKGNIENAVKRIPKMGKHTEIIFVEGHSTDGTLEEIKRVCKKYSKKIDLKYTKQDGKGKGDAVRKGFKMARGDILMILDADLTVPPEDLTKFYDAISTGKGEFINGSRLVYPMEDEAMRMLNILGNKFFSVMFTWILGQKLKDTLCGTKALFRKDYEKISANRSYFGDFDPFGDFDLLFGSAKLNLKIVELPVRYMAREYGSTNISRFKHGWLLLKMVIFAMNKIKFV